MRKITLVPAIALASISFGCATMLAVASPASAAKYKPPAAGVASNGVTSAHVCKLLTIAQAQSLLNGSPPVGPGTPQSIPGQATCTWADSAGSNATVMVTGSSGPLSCSKPAKAVAGKGWKGCYYAAETDMAFRKGNYAVSVQEDFGGTSPNLRAADVSALNSIYKALHL